MFDLLIILLATFWAWLTLRYTWENTFPQAFYVTRMFHPLLVLSMPLYLLWPDVITAMAVAGGVGVLVVLLDRLTVSSTPQQVQVPRRSRGDLPPLP